MRFPTIRVEAAPRAPAPELCVCRGPDPARFRAVLFSTRQRRSCREGDALSQFAAGMPRRHWPARAPQPTEAVDRNGHDHAPRSAPLRVCPSRHHRRAAFATGPAGCAGSRVPTCSESARRPRAGARVGAQPKWNSFHPASSGDQSTGLRSRGPHVRIVRGVPEQGRLAP
jgi:hypothetical protein